MVLFICFHEVLDRLHHFKSRLVLRDEVLLSLVDQVIELNLVDQKLLLQHLKRLVLLLSASRILTIPRHQNAGLAALGKRAEDIVEFAEDAALLLVGLLNTSRN